MKITTRLLGVLLLIGGTLFTTSCNNDGYVAVLSYATVKGESPNYRLEIDEGGILEIEKNHASGFIVKNNQRVIANYTINENDKLSMQNPPIYKVTVNQLYPILTKKPLLASQVSSKESQDSIGYDKSSIHGVWCSSDHINVNYSLLRDDPTKRHFINLVIDDTKSTEEDLYATFRHNAYNDQRAVSVNDDVSFLSEGLIPEGKDSIKVHIEYDSYSGDTKTETTTLKRINSPTQVTAGERSSSMIVD